MRSKACAPGAYRYQPAGHALVRASRPAGGGPAPRRARPRSTRTSSATPPWCSCWPSTAPASPPIRSAPARGYRHAFLEAGLVGERVYLEAAARGLGACAVGAFYDDEAAALVGVDPAREWVVHFAALGVKA